MELKYWFQYCSSYLGFVWQLNGLIQLDSDITVIGIIFGMAHHHFKCL